MKALKHTSSAVLFVLVAACSGSGGGSADAQPDPLSDDDGDGVAFVEDRCPETPSNDWTAKDGCAEDGDGDGDGLSTDRDLCPNTPAGEPADDSGCSVSQRASGAVDMADAPADRGGAETDPAPTPGARAAAEIWTPESDGAVAGNGFATFLLDPKGAVPVLLRTLEKNVTVTENGFRIAGTLLIEVPGDRQVVLAEAEVELTRDPDQGVGLQSFQGTARVPFPDFGFMQDREVEDLAYASVGWDFGRNLEHVDAPLARERKYFYFTFSAGLEAKFGEMTISAPINQSVTMALDPSDPAFFLRGALGGLLPMDEGSFGFSIGGHLRFDPANSWGLDADKMAFSGHLWTGGQVNLNPLKIPVAIGGNTVYDFDPNDDGRSVFEDPLDGMQYGSNGDLLVSLDAVVLSFEVPVASATIVGRLGADEAYGAFSGVLNGGNGWMPDVVPVKYTNTLKTAGYVSSRIDESYLTASGDLALDAGTLGEWTGLDLEDLALANGTLTIDASGMLVTGRAATRFSPVIALSGEIAAEAFFNGKPEDWYVALDGQLLVGGVDLSSNAQARLDHRGLFVNGSFTTPISNIAMAGSITKAGADLRGSAGVSIPIVAGKEIVQWVTDAAVCGTETVADAALCGTKTVQDGVHCGYDHVTSAALCGTRTVTDAALCGTSYVTSAGQCGTQTVTSAAKCGVDVFSDIAHCGLGCVSSIFTDCSCEVARTCDVPKSCETKVVVPDFDYGTFEGSIALRIGNSGLTGSVSGEYCEHGGGCTTLANGRVKLSSGKPEACVTVASLGEFCAPF